MEAIKQLGTNGGGFLNPNSAHPFENPTGLTNWLSIYLLLSIPFALTYTFGKMVGSVRHGAALLAAMVIIYGVWVGFTTLRRAPAQPGRGRPPGSQETRATWKARTPASATRSTALFGVASTNTSTGSADASYDSFTPIGGFGLLTGMMLGEVTPGGVGQRALHHPHLRHHRRLHRRADDRANTGVPRQEDPGQGGEAGRPRRPGHAHHRARPHRRSPCRSTPGGPAR